jgi:hypothetical protein
MQIDIDFDVYKALTARRDHEGHSYNDVLRELLGLDSFQEPDTPEPPYSAAADAITIAVTNGFFSRGVSLPNGSQLRARYKQREYHARIVDDRWLDEGDREHTSPSAAAAAITGTNVNGLRFWEVRRPGDAGWRRLELLRGSP